MNEEMKKRGWKIGRRVFLVLVVIIALVVISNAYFVVHPNEYGVVSQFGAVVDVKSEPGLYLKVPFVQQASTLPQTVLLYDLPVSDMISADKTTLIADCFAIWEISDPRLFIETLSGSIANAEGRINANVYNALKTVMSSMTQAEIISGRDGRLVAAIMDNIGNSFDRYGIHLIAVETKKIDLPDDNKTAVFNRMISERNNIAAAYLAEGESEAKEIRNEADKKAPDHAGGGGGPGGHHPGGGRRGVYAHPQRGVRLPGGGGVLHLHDRPGRPRESMTGEEKTLILDGDSPIAQIFY